MVLDIIVCHNSLKTLCAEKEIHLLWHKLEADNPLLYSYINNYIPLKKKAQIFRDLLFVSPSVIYITIYVYNL